MTRWSGRDLVLAGSVAVNLLLAGFLIGAGARVLGPAEPPPSAAPSGGPINPLMLLAGLDPDEREAVRRRFREEGRQALGALREAREARAAFYAAISAEPFDQAAAAAALDRARAAERGLQDRSDDLMVSVLADLPAAERQALVTRLAELRRRVRGGERGFRGGPPGGQPAPPADRPAPGAP